MALSTLTIPTATPQVSQPDASSSPNLPPSAFGATQAQGLQQLGGSLSKAGAEWGQIVSDDVSNQFQDNANKILHGDPNATITNPDGSTSPDLGYLGLKGRSALDQRQTYEKRLDALQKDAYSKLLTPIQQRDFDNMTRRYRAVISGQMGSHADQQANAYGVETNLSTIKIGAQNISVNPDNEDTFLHNSADMVNAAVKAAELKGAVKGDPMWNQAANNARAAAADARIRAVGARTDGAGAAAAMTEHYKDWLGPHYAVLADHFRSRAESESAVGGGINLFNELSSTPPSSVPAPKITGVKTDAQSALESKGIPLRITSEARTPEHNRAVGGAPNSQHVTGQAMDIGLAGYSDEQKQAVLDQFLKDPRVTGIGWEGDHLHVDTGRAQKTAWGADDTPASLAKAPPWVQERVNAWKSSPQVAQTEAGEEKPALNAPPDLKQPETPLEKLARVTEQGVQRIETMNLPPKQKEQMLNAFRTQVATHEMAINLTKKAAEDTYHQALGGYVDDMVNGKTGDIVQRINADPRVPPEHKMALIEMARKESGNPNSVVSFGPGWKDATTNVLKKPGEEGYIGDASEIIKMGPAGTNQLTATGVQDVLKTRALAMKDIDQHGIQQTRASVMKWAYSQLVVDHEMLFPGLPPRKDKKGEDAYDGTFVPKVNAAYTQFMQKSGANPLEFWTQDNMKTLMSGIRSPSEVAAERALAGLQKPIEQQPIPATPEGVNNDSWKTLVKAPPVSKNGKQWPMKDWAQALDILRANPTPENIKNFDSVFGPAGYSGKEILEHLAPPKPAAQPFVTNQGMAVP